MPPPIVSFSTGFMPSSVHSSSVQPLSSLPSATCGARDKQTYNSPWGAHGLERQAALRSSKQTLGGHV